MFHLYSITWQYIYYENFKNIYIKSLLLKDYMKQMMCIYVICTPDDRVDSIGFYRKTTKICILYNIHVYLFYTHKGEQAL